MDEHDLSMHQAEPAPSFWQSRAGFTLIVFLVVAALMLGYEHRLHLFASGMFPAVLLLGCVFMHFFMHGGHGGHAGHGSSGKPQANPVSTSLKNDGDRS